MLSTVPFIVMRHDAALPSTRGVASPGPAVVREWAPAYEDEGSTTQSRGAVTVSRDGWWSIALTVPIALRSAAEQPVLIRLERHGAPTPAAGGTAHEVVVPATEVDAVVALLAGVVEQARRDGVLPPPDAPRSERRS